MNVVHWDGLSPAPQSIQNHVVSIGNFDGVHRGHAELLLQLNRLQQEVKQPSLVVTFDPPPIKVLKPDALVEQLTTLDARITLISLANIDTVLVLQSSKPLLELSAWDFWKNLLIKQLKIRGMVEGRNFCFGKNRQGTIDLLAAWCKDQSIPLEVIDDVYLEGEKVSSSEIRQALKFGNIKLVNRNLGRTYSISGLVVQGERRGKTIGFPTCNLSEIRTLIPRDGVYACLARCLDQAWPAAVNIGPNPTFGVMHRKVEAHLLRFQGDLYGQLITLQFIERLRDTHAFTSLQALQSQLQQDILQVDKIVTGFQENSHHVDQRSITKS